MSKSNEKVTSQHVEDKTPELIAKYRALVDEGAMTEEEFNEKKKALLASDNNQAPITSKKLNPTLKYIISVVIFVVLYFAYVSWETDRQMDKAYKEYDKAMDKATKDMEKLMKNNR